MKQLLSILALLFVTTFVSAQIKKIPKDLSPKRKITAVQNVTTNYEHAKLDVFITQTEGKGETLNFTSSINIAKVEISFIDIANSAQFATYKAGIKEGHFYLESGTYKGGLQKGYTLNFYVLRNERPIWTVTVGPKK